MRRDNCFDLVRFLAAASVIYFHHSLMFGIEPPKLDKGFGIGSIAVQVFFSVSGFLIAMSFVRSENFLSYMGKRARRIFPAITFCAFIMVYFFASLYSDNIIQHITSWDSFLSFLKVSSLYGRNIPGLWEAINAHKESNGPLWTLPYEMSMYIILGVSLSIHNTWKSPACLLILCVGLSVLGGSDLKNTGMYYSTFSKLAEFGISFFTGSLLFMTMKTWNNSKTRMNLALLSLLMIVILRGGSDMLTLGSMSIAILVIMISMSFKDSLINGRFDISYGMYIWGWPIQILVIHYIPFSKDFFLVSLSITYALVIMVATFSWLVIEKPFIRRKSIDLVVNQRGLAA